MLWQYVIFIILLWLRHLTFSVLLLVKNGANVILNYIKPTKILNAHFNKPDDAFKTVFKDIFELLILPTLIRHWPIYYEDVFRGLHTTKILKPKPGICRHSPKAQDETKQVGCFLSSPAYKCTFVTQIFYGENLHTNH